MKTEIIHFENYSFEVFVDPSMKSLSNDTTVKRRAEEAKDFLRKYPTPSMIEKNIKL